MNLNIPIETLQRILSERGVSDEQLRGVLRDLSLWQEAQAAKPAEAPSWPVPYPAQPAPPPWSPQSWPLYTPTTTGEPIPSLPRVWCGEPSSSGDAPVLFPSFQTIPAVVEEVDASAFYTSEAEMWASAEM